MDYQPIRETVTALQAERNTVEADVARLRDSLAGAETRLARIDAAIENLALLSGDVHDKAEPQVDPRKAPETGRKKIQSTRMVTELINELGRPLDRDEVQREFSAKFGIPPTWSNPRNSLSNALQRASEQGLIARLGRDRFAPIGRNGAEPQEVAYG